MKFNGTKIIVVRLGTECIELCFQSLFLQGGCSLIPREAEVRFTLCLTLVSLSPPPLFLHGSLHSPSHPSCFLLIPSHTPIFLPHSCYSLSTHSEASGEVVEIAFVNSCFAFSSLVLGGG
ncbi:hypothetical protein NP493_543g01038 [Ridgeia piscesae]|uniref:Uncharacterized protein n=1 Tax=Ridgeia piscesae TaxID=27915 RepID=A0AAD9KW13_RIDPI|nr:hypothetical protein NP493_543g01038 [Ridgeia piscesae]